MNRIHHLHHPVLPPVKQLHPKPGSDFQEVLKNADVIKISKHARQRLTERDIHMDAGQWQEISKKVNEAKQKGITDSLVLTDKAALLVSVKNNTVVTAMNHTEAEDRIFTNIDGTILMKK